MDDYDPEKNYIRLIETIEELEDKNFRLTEDWYERHKKYILKYREVFPNFKFVNKDFEDKEFRILAREVEMIISNLVHEIKVNNSFDLELYLVLNKNIKQLCDMLNEESELMNMISRLSMDF